MGSDHNAVYFEIQLNENISLQEISLRKNFREADWNLYRKEIENRLLNDRLNIDEITETSQVDSLVEKLHNTMLIAQSVAVPRAMPTTYKLILTPEIKELIKIKLREILRMEVRQLQKEITEKINDLRNDNWNFKLQSLYPTITTVCGI